jgi:hypothetical protein
VAGVAAPVAAQVQHDAGRRPRQGEGRRQVGLRDGERLQAVDPQVAQAAVEPTHGRDGGRRLAGSGSGQPGLCSSGGAVPAGSNASSRCRLYAWAAASISWHVAAVTGSVRAPNRRSSSAIRAPIRSCCGDRSRSQPVSVRTTSRTAGRFVPIMARR